jgi:hypothetical protein
VKIYGMQVVRNMAKAHPPRKERADQSSLSFIYEYEQSFKTENGKMGRKTYTRELRELQAALLSSGVGQRQTNGGEWSSEMG